jgi:hypothetical protein
MPSWKILDPPDVEQSGGKITVTYHYLIGDLQKSWPNVFPEGMRRRDFKAELANLLAQGKEPIPRELGADGGSIGLAVAADLHRREGPSRSV